jgi:hypothetical protein
MLRPRRLERAVRSRPRRERFPLLDAFADFFEADRPRAFFEAAWVSNDVEAIRKRTRRRLIDMNATLGERLSFIGNSLEKMNTTPTAEQ